MIQFNKYSSPEGDADRLAAIAARRYLWGDASALSEIPTKLPTNFFYKQEIVSCLGMELACDKYNLSEERYEMYRGVFPLDAEAPKAVYKGEMLYQPRQSGFFSVIENIIVAAFVAELNDKKLVLDGTYDWWGYEEPFNKIFPDIEVLEKLPTAPQAVHFESMRDSIFKGDDDYVKMFMAFKDNFYINVRRNIQSFYDGDTYNVRDSGLVFVRGGDKLQAETVEPPPHTFITDLRNLSRRVRKTFILSDDHEYAEKIKNLGTGLTRNITPTTAKGYHHNYSGKVSCMPILKNFIALVEAKESMACPSANLVNAAHWCRSMYSGHPQSLFNPVFRYVLI